MIIDFSYFVIKQNKTKQKQQQNKTKNEQQTNKK